MVRTRRWWFRLLIGLPIVALGPAFMGPVASDETDLATSVEVISPPDHAVLMSGSFDVICRTEAEADLEINGRPHAWEPFEPPVRVAHVRLSPGWHELRIGDRRMGVVVALNEDEHDGPADWQIYRSHSMDQDAARCGDCHQTKKDNGRIAVGDLLGYKACFKCHDSADCGATQTQTPEPLKDCQKCHVLHGSSRKGLLKSAVK